MGQTRLPRRETSSTRSSVALYYKTNGSISVYTLKIVPLLPDRALQCLPKSVFMNTLGKYGCQHRKALGLSKMAYIWTVHIFWAGLGGSVGCAVRLETRRSRVQPPPRSATFFRGDWSWNIFYGHSLPSADSRRAVVSFWRKNLHKTG